MSAAVDGGEGAHFLRFQARRTNVHVTCTLENLTFRVTEFKR
jgi:hypothetical protein